METERIENSVDADEGGSNSGAKTSQSTSASCNNGSGTTSNRRRKVSGDPDLKSKIIEFMRDRPFLWNSKHHLYKDSRRRENEFHLFSEAVNHPATEIKRVWHVLRTNFFRAHKLMLEKPHSSSANNVKNDKGGDNDGSCCSESNDGKLWKYYLAMEFILEGTQYGNKSTSETSNDANETSLNSAINNSDSNNNNSSASLRDNHSSASTQDSSSSARQTRSSKMFKNSRGVRKKVPNNQLVLASESNSNNSSQQNAIVTTPAGTDCSLVDFVSHFSDSSAHGRDGTPPALELETSAIANPKYRNTRAQPANKNRKITPNNNINYVSTATTPTTDTNSNHSPQLNRKRVSNSSGFNDLSLVSYESDEDHLYARSLTSTLKKFDPTTKEVIKLKFQEIIVEFMHRQQQQQEEQQPAQNQLQKFKLKLEQAVQPSREEEPREQQQAKP